MSERNRRVLLVQPRFSALYRGTRIRAGMITAPPLSLACLAAPLREGGFRVEVLDLNARGGDPDPVFREAIRRLAPSLVGITFTTPLAPEASRLAAVVREESPEATVVAGGPHATSMPEDVLKGSEFDVVVLAEGDHALRDLLESPDPHRVAGLALKERDGVVRTGRAETVANLDSLPMPAWDLFDLASYGRRQLLSLTRHPGWIETSRGCVYECCYCNKNIFGRRFRVKSPERVLSEMDFMLRTGFSELFVADDCFTVDKRRVGEICDLILGKGLAFPWSTVTGIRADLVDFDLLEKMRRAGCYRVYYGIESGNQKILDGVGKRLNLEDVRRAVALSRKAGLETVGFFMLALPGETRETLNETVTLARSLDLDMAKTSITVPLPGTPFYEQLEREGRLRTRDWSKFNLYHPAREIYDHPTVDWDSVEDAFRRFYRGFYLRPRFLAKRLRRIRSVRTLFEDLGYLLGTRW